MKVTLLHATPLTACLEAAKICRGSENPERALKNALISGHVSLKENWYGQFLIEGVSRALSHQLVRKRMASYAQQSQRHCLPEEFIIPPCEYLNADDKESVDMIFKNEIKRQQDTYDKLLSLNVAKEDARFILGQGFTTKLTMTINARSLCEFFKDRLCRRAQWEIRELANKILNICRNEAPGLFIGPFPDCGNCKEPCNKKG